jgi:predicted DNA-binding antitoxin AbrB/MazE fold protein
VSIIEAEFEDGLLRPVRPLHLRPGERVRVLVMRKADPARWDLARLAHGAAEDEALAAAGLDGWRDTLEGEDNG